METRTSPTQARASSANAMAATVGSQRRKSDFTHIKPNRNSAFVSEQGSRLVPAARNMRNSLLAAALTALYPANSEGFLACPQKKQPSILSILDQSAFGALTQIKPDQNNYVFSRNMPDSGVWSH